MHGVLQRIALAFGDAADPYSLEGYFGTHLDRALLGAAHLYRGEGVPFDPEGLASTLPAMAQVLLGWWVGQAVAAARRIDERLLLRLLVHAALLLVLAWAWQLAMPLNKKLWTSSYVLFSGGCAVAALAVLLHALEPRAAAGGVPAWARFCEGFGRNALFVFVLSGLVPRLLSLVRWEDAPATDGTPRWITPLPWLYRTVFAGPGSDPRLGSLLFACANLAAYAAIAAWMDRRRWYVRV
jgi:predicted acyltransferase